MSPDVRQGGRTGWLACVVVAAVSTGSCDEQPEIIVKRIETKSETIQGPGALSEVGDYLLANRQIRVVVQNEDFSRGFGIYGGSLIDADLQRSSSLTGGEGYDNFSELFPGLFLKAMRPTSIRTTRNDDGSASVIVEGAADEFLFLASRVNDLLLDGPAILFTNEYRLSPGNRYVEIITTITNASPDRQPIEFPTAAARTLLGDTPFIFPGGDVILFGKGNDVFAPGVGFDLLLGQTEALQNPAPPPALPGLVTPLLATRGRRVSYGFLSGETTMDGSLIGQTNTPGGLGDLVVPFVASSFTGAYYAALPARLEVGQTFSFKKYFIVGDGDVASIRDEAFAIRGESTAPVTGRVLDEGASSPESGAEIVVFDAQGRPYNHHRTDAGGRFRGRYPPGTYRYVVVADGRYPTAVESFEVDDQTGASLDVRLPSPGTVTVRITDAQGRTMPGRCALVGTYAMPMGTASGRTFLYDPTIGERARTVDSVPDTDDPTTRRFVEEVIVAANGIATERVRPGRYRAYCSRGIEWSVYEQTVIVADGATAGIDALLQPQMNTSGWASADFHLHAVNSVDSSMSLPRRVAAVAAEGVDLAVSSDHNFITDYTQAIADQDLERYVQSMVGMELTTLEAGHFNAFPLIFDAEPVTNGAFAWPGLTPQALFDALRDRGQLGRAQTVVQVNHPRDSILGYFDNYNFNQDTVEPEDDNGFLARTQEEFRASAFSFDFDAIEVFNGSRVELLRNQRVPNQLPPGVTFEQVGPPGSVYRTEDGEIGFPGGMDD
ncbi:MAG: carboxypeptidase regulatory-like domain-containing protein, partial [Myxococcota bacterium]